MRDPGHRDRAHHVQSSSRKVIEEHLLGRIRLDRLEIRPVATPVRCESSSTINRVDQQQRGSEVTPSEIHSNIMLLKVMLPGEKMKTLERNSLAALSKKASTGHMGTLKALSNAGASLAMKKVLINGEPRDHANAKRVLEELQKVDVEAKKLLNLVSSIDTVKSARAAECFKAVQSIRQLLAEDASKLQVASRLGACEASLDALTKFGSFELDFGEFFGSFSTPFHAGRNAEFYRQIWALLTQLAVADQEAEKATSAKKSVDSLEDFDDSAEASRTATTTTWIQKLRDAMASASPALLKAMKDEKAVDALRRVMAFGNLEHVKIAEDILNLFSDISEDAIKLAHYRQVLGLFSRATTFDSEELKCVRNLFERALPRPEPDMFSLFFQRAARASSDLEGQIIRRFGLQQVGQQLVRCGGPGHSLGNEILTALGEERPSKRLRSA